MAQQLGSDYKSDILINKLLSHGNFLEVQTAYPTVRSVIRETLSRINPRYILSESKLWSPFRVES